MKILAKDLKEGDKILVAGKILKVTHIEISEIGKQGKRKVRIEATTPEEKKVILIRPEDYPFDTPDS